MNINCPLPTELTDIPASSCPFNFDQIVRVLFQRRQVAASPFADETALKTKANWDTLIAASDATKVVTSPIFAGFTIPASEALTSGGNDNTTFMGLAEYSGEGSITTTGTFRRVAPAILSAMDDLTQYSLATAVGTSELTAYLVNKDGFIFCNSDFRGIPIFNWRVSSVGSEGLNAPNINNFGFALLPYWDRNLVSVKPTFDPLTAL